MSLDTEKMGDIKKYITIAQSLSAEAKNPLEGSEIEKDASLQQMETLLASNCQKLCLGPSFHFYTSEKSADCFNEEMNQTEEPRSEADDDQFETVIYNGPDAPYEIVEETKHHEYKTIPPDVKLKLMNAKLAEKTAECGGLLTPHFFLDSPDILPVSSSSDEVTSVTVAGSEKKKLTCPFAFPTVDLNQDASQSHGDTIANLLERVEILDVDPNDKNKAKFVEWPKKYIESKGFCLGIQPGNFFKDTSLSCFYVKLPHRSNYEVVVTNNNQVPCDLDLHVNGQHVAALRLPAGTIRSIDGPQYSEHAFKIFRAKDAPSDKKVTEGEKANGIVKAVFTPCKIRDSRLRAVSEPLRAGGRRTKDFLDLFDEPRDKKKQRSYTIGATGEDKAERSLDISRVAEGVTLLQGTKKKKNYVLAPEMETDPSKRIILQLRLIASLDEEVNSTEEEVHHLEPPPLPTR